MTLVKSSSKISAMQLAYSTIEQPELVGYLALLNLPASVEVQKNLDFGQAVSTFMLFIIVLPVFRLLKLWIRIF